MSQCNINMVRIAVIGCGQMGLKIAGELAYHGHRVKLYDSSKVALNSAYERIEADKTQLINDGLIHSSNFVGQILCLSMLKDAVYDAEFVLEAIADDLQEKIKIFKEITQHCSSTTVLATNTLLLDISHIVEELSCKDRLIGLRFLFPVYFINEVEITTTSYTSPDTVEKVRVLMQRMGKTLFFRSGLEPCILSEDQREARKLAALKQKQFESSGNVWLHQQSSSMLNSATNQSQHDDTSSYESQMSDKDCAICMDRSRDCLLCPCNHLVTCRECAQALCSRNDGCPVCRKEISQIIHVYYS